LVLIAKAKLVETYGGLYNVPGDYVTW